MRALPGFRLTTSARAAKTMPPGCGQFLMVTEEEEAAEVTGLTELDRDHAVLGSGRHGARQLSAGAPGGGPRPARTDRAAMEPTGYRWERRGAQGPNGTGRLQAQWSPPDKGGSAA